MNLQRVAHQLDGIVTAGAISCSGPGHSRHDRSLRVFPDAKSPIGFRVHSLAGDAWQDCANHVCRLLGIPEWRPGQSAKYSPPKIMPLASTDTAIRSKKAISIWEQAVPITGTLGEVYLANRIGHEMKWPDDLRFHPACVRNLEGKIEQHPAFIALLRDVHTDEPRAIQRTFLKADGCDRLRDQMGKAALGPAAGTVCKLSPNDTVTHGLGITEGIEKGLALLAINWRPIWSTSGTGNMTAFPVINGVEVLTIFSDDDVPGIRAATTCAGRWMEAGRQCRIVAPREKSHDWDDITRRAAP